MTKIKCKLCNTIVDGKELGCLIFCKCKKCAIDETKYYCRIIGDTKNWEKIEEES